MENLGQPPVSLNLADHKKQNRADRRVVVAFAALVVMIAGSVALYIFSRTYAKAWRIGVPMSPEAFDSILSRAIPALIGMSAAAAIIAVVSLSFQTITQSRILTPSMIGFDAVFIATQTGLVFAFGGHSQIFLNPYLNFFVSAAIMVLVSLVMYGFILRSGKNNIIFLLMFGLILSGILMNGARYLQVIMDTHDFYQVQAAVNVNVNNMNTSIIFITLPILAVLLVVILSRHNRYNVMILGSEQSKGLGLAYEREMSVNLVLISIGMSVATALIGPLTFLGLLAVNVARELLKTHKHLPLFVCSAGLAMLALIMGQAVVELMLGAVPVTVIINIVGCSYVFYLILKENRM